MLATIRYRVKPEHLEEHLRLLRSVYEELDSTDPDGLRWATFQLQDEASFIDLVMGPDLPQPLPQLGTFQAYRAGLDHRCEEPPVYRELNEVGSFHFP